MRPGPSPEIINRIEAIEKIAIAECLARFYIEKKLSYRQLCARWRINTRTLMRLMRHNNIEPRRGGDAIRAQWLNAPKKRREKSARLMRELTRRIKIEKRHPYLGKTKENNVSIKAIADALKKSSSMFRPEVRAKAGISKKLFIRRNPLEHATSKMLPTRAENELLEHFFSKGYNPIHNHIVSTTMGPKWLNLFFPALNLAIGCENVSRFPLDWRRHAAISELGIRMIYITNRRIYHGQWQGLDQYVFHVNSIRPYPTAHGKNTVIWGRINPESFAFQSDQTTIEHIRMNGLNELLFTTTGNDPVLAAYRANLLPA